MNYLGHLYLSGDSLPLMVANLYGDFVKGRDYTYLPKTIQKGVTLHRTIDDFVDHHSAVTSLRLELYKDLPRVAGIAIDLYFDHLLAKNWKNYHTTPLSQFVREFYHYLNEHVLTSEAMDFSYSREFVHLLKVMQHNDWLNQYAKLKGLTMASTGLSKRIAFENNLDEATTIFTKNEEAITKVFHEYMGDATRKFQR